MAVVAGEKKPDWSSKFQKHWPLVVLALIVLAGAGLRLSIMTESLWIDELHTAWTVNGTLPEVFSRGAMGNQGPVYFVALWLWNHVAGMSEVSLRLPSWLAGVALPAVVYWSVKKLDVDKEQHNLVAIIAAFCAATDGYAIFYSQEARPYAWVILGSVWHFTAFVFWLRNPTRWRGIGVAVGMALLFYLHFTTALLVRLALISLYSLLATLVGSRAEICLLTALVIQPVSDLSAGTNTSAFRQLCCFFVAQQRTTRLVATKNTGNVATGI